MNRQVLASGRFLREALVGILTLIKCDLGPIPPVAADPSRPTEPQSKERHSGHC
jgi:hypothetical protein